MRISSADFLENYGALTDKALSEPVTITRDGRDRLVLLSIEEYEGSNGATHRTCW
jgi:PHD/YefM family antitoxin component YafN of YafNO toxin-antitoxin module